MPDTTTKVKKPARKKTKKTPAKEAAAPKEKKKGTIKSFLLWSLLILVILILATALFYGYYYFFKFKALAEYKGGKVTRDEFVKVLRTETGKYDPLIWKDEKQSLKIKKNILDKLIEEHILLAMAQKKNIGVSDEELKIELDSYKSGYTENTFRKMLKLKGISYDDWVKRKKARYLTQKLIRQEVIDKIEISQDDINKYYQENSKEFIHPEQVRARHILVNTWEEAEKIQKELEQGANFAALAKKKSISPDRWKGGDIGYFQRGTHPKVFDQVCFNTPVGKTSQIVKSDYGYHIFKVIDKRGPAKESLQQAEEYIITRLQQQRSKEAFEKWFKPIYDAASVKINYDLLKQIEVVNGKSVEN